MASAQLLPLCIKFVDNIKPLAALKQQCFISPKKLIHRSWTRIEQKLRSKIPIAFKIPQWYQNRALPYHPLAFHVQSIGRYKTIIPIAIPIIPNSPDCGPSAVAEPVLVAVAAAADALLAREATTDEAEVAAADAPDLAAPTTAADVEDAADLVALVAVAGDMLPVVSLGRTRSTPTLLQSPIVMVLVSGEELRVQYGSRFSAGRDRESIGKRGTHCQDRLLSRLLRLRGGEF